MENSITNRHAETDYGREPSPPDTILAIPSRMGAVELDPGVVVGALILIFLFLIVRDL